MNQNALIAAEILVAAYERGEENGAHVDWNDINDAHQFALEALREHEEEQHRRAADRALVVLPPLRVSVALVREEEPRYRYTIRSAADIWDMLREEAKAWDRERLLVVALDGANHVIGVETVAMGTLNSCQMHPREVFKGLILANAARFIAVHNHPSGSCAPSAEDRDVTKKLKAAGELVGIPLLDHVILGADAYHSFADAHGL